MNKIYESPLHGYGESGESVHIYEISNEEWWEIDKMNHDEKCELIGVVDESKYPYAIIPGSQYTSYDFDLASNHFIVYEIISIDC